MVRKTYAQIFVDHRITDTVVADLDKEHLKDMGITVVGDVIAILKQCKKVGHEVDWRQPCFSSLFDRILHLSFPLSPQPRQRRRRTISLQVVLLRSSLRPNHHVCSTSFVMFSLGRPLPTPPRRLPPADEGGYIVKHPSGTTAKTRRILASLKQRATSTTQIKHTVKGPKKTALPGPQPNIVRAVKAFDDSDMDESDGYRVIISKKFDEVTPSGSVFARLGALTGTSGCPPDRSLGNMTASKRKTEHNIPVQSYWSPQKSIPLSVTANASLHHTSIGVTRNNLSSTNTVLSRPAGSSVKRQASDSVFSRLSGQTVSEVSAINTRRSLPESRDSPLSYADVFKCPRIQPPSVSSDKKRNFVRAKSASYTEGILSSSLIARKSRRDIPVKRRLGTRYTVFHATLFCLPIRIGVC
ncbi:uncharacterized protein DEA37_0008237 [Paragonimus westermani]|uniref:SAM domain-containing protein n=1 Tax=Paragonimus westermani TaxID=34504 RepID=A0A5J4NGL8_9TREM|nr:uncharacterized protein DEA37_0008237 [Paragonimus westermani]